MYSGTSIAGRTRCKTRMAGKQCSENDSEHRNQLELEEVASQEECCSVYSVSDDDDGDQDVSKRRGIAGRTRSHFSTSKFRTSKTGTFSNPINIDNEEEENETEVTTQNLASSSEDCENPKVTTERISEEFDKILSEYLHSKRVASPENLASSSDEIEVTPKRRRKEIDDLEVLSEHNQHGDGEGVAVAPLENSSTSSVKEENLNLMSAQLNVSSPLEKLESEDELDILWAEAAMEDEESPQVTKSETDEDDELLSLGVCEDESGVQEDTRPCSPSKLSHPLEKSDSEEESESNYLWAELEDGLEEDKEVEDDHSDDDPCCPEGEDSVKARCQRGDHYPMMNDEIGEICKYCLHVIRDIRDCDPLFGKNPSGRSGGRYSPRSEDCDDSFSDSELESSGGDYKSSRFVTYAPTGTVWDIIPRAKKRMYDHQHEAFEFLWSSLAGGIVLENLEKQLDFASGHGCIISHAPGTGKTFLTIAFLSAFMRRYPNCRPMIIAPSNILHIWERELKKWEVADPVPFHNLNNPDLSGEETKSAMTRLRRRSANRAHNTIAIRWVKVCSWREATSILGISYTLFDKLARKGSDSVKKALFELPGLVVLDEGHTPRNSRSHIWEALSNIKTKRRIILSGTPFQNNFKELNNTLRLAKPSGTKGNLEYLLKSYDRVGTDSERNEIIANIRDVIKPFVHVHKGTVLQEKLPGLRESVVRLMPSRTQMLIFEYIQNLRNRGLEGKGGSYNWFIFERWMSLASVHHSLFASVLTDLPERERVALNALLEKQESSPEAGVKTKFVMDFIRQSERMKEKVLIFSQYIDPLSFLANEIKSRFHWNEGEQLMVIHGKTQEGIRQASIDSFNDPNSKARVMLASTKTCYEGINLVGASRVILLDTLWNPSAERQAVSRAYRIGQRKIVYTYRLITAGAWDEQKLYIQAEKDKLSESLFFGYDEDGHQQNVFEDKLIKKMIHRFGTKITKRGVTILLESEE